MKKIFKHILRKLGLLKFADYLRFCIIYVNTYKARKEFKKNNPDVVLPPPYYIYETFGLNYDDFYTGSIETAKWLVSYFKKYKKLTNANILDWGCGPGRTIRHIPFIIDKTCQCYGSDYNRKYIDWCANNISNIKFVYNQLEPPLPFEDNKFEVIYGISIFTHLSEKMHHAWFKELARVLKPGGILFLTLHGTAFREKLPKEEQSEFDSGRLVVLSHTKEGHRTFATFHPEAFIKSLAAEINCKVVEFEKGGVINGKPQQDVWIFQKGE